MKGGTLYQASTNMGNISSSVWHLAGVKIYVIDGQNESAILSHLVNNDTHGYDPCLPLPLNNIDASRWYSVDISIMFNPSEIVDSNQWLPHNICSTHNNHFKNSYMFDANVCTLTINNLIIENYHKHPFIQSDEFHCYNCKFSNISYFGTYPLFDANHILLQNSDFNGIQTSTPINHGCYEIRMDYTNFFDVAVDSLLDVGVM